MKYLKIIIVTVFSIHSNFCQSQDLKWAADFGNTELNNTSSLVTKTAANGDYIVVGVLQGTVDFDFSSAVQNVTATYKNVFIARYSSAGNFIWVKLLKGTIYYESSEPTCNIDPNGNIILALRSDDTVDFDPSTSEFKLSSAYNETVATYLAKYDGSGNFIWAKKFQNEKGIYPSRIEADADGNIFLGGSYYYNQDFDLSSASNILYGDNQTTNVFLAKYNPLGGLIFAKVLINANSGAGITAMKLINNTDLVFVGSFYSGDFNTAGPAVYLTGGSNGQFVAKYKTDGTFVCANSIYISQYIGFVRDITVDADGNMYVVGDFSGEVDFNGPTNTGQVIISKHSYTPDGFVVKYNSQAQVVWYFSIGGTDWDKCNAVAIDSDNNLLIIGLFSMEVDFDPSLASYKSLVNTGGTAVFAATYTLNKGYISAKQLTFPSDGMDMYNGMLMNASNEFMIRGIAYRATDVDPSSNEVIMAPAGSASSPTYYVSVYKGAAPLTTSVVNENETLFSAYPNPLTDGILYINSLDYTVLNSVPVITSLDGRMISFTYTQDQEKFILDLSDLSKGVYFATINGSTVKIIR